MTQKLKTPKCLKQFLVHQKGTVALFTAIAAIPMLLAVGTAVDLSRLNAAQTQTQNAIDAAALTGASLKGSTAAERIAAAQKSFAGNTTSGIASKMSPVATFQVVDDIMIGDAEIAVPSAFMHLAGLDLMQGNAHAEVNILSDKKAEIVMVLDYSGSMWDPVAGKVKYEVMRDAAKKLVTDLSKTNPDDIKFGIVPFSNHVYTTMSGSYVKNASGTWTGCTQDRPHPSNITDDTPTDDVATQWGQPLYSGPKTEEDIDQEKYTCDGLIDNNMKIIDLTNDFKKITSQLELMKPYGYTHIALGTEFGYHMLSPNAPFTQGAKYDDKTTKKFMVVLTDGKQTARGFGAGTVRSVEQGDTNLASLCEGAKAKGITMMTVAFDLDDPDTVDRLQTCASDSSSGFFVAKNDEALQSAFESIKQAVASDIYLSN